MENFSKYLCIFGGGAVRGYSYLGVLRAFEEVGFFPEKYAGSSVGAVFAAFCALGIPLKEMEKIFVEVNFELFKDINFSLKPTFSLSKGGVFLDWLREIIEKQFYKEGYIKGNNKPVCFKDLDKDLILISTDLKNGKPFIFSKKNTPNFEIALAIRISASMPGLLAPYNYEDKILADGDLMKSNPMWRIDNELCPEDYNILELRLEGICDGEMKNFFDYINTVYSCITNYSTDYIINMYSHKDKFNYIKIDTKDLILVNFNIDDKTKEKLSEIGYFSAMKFFKKELPEKKKKLLPLYNLLLINTENLEKLITKNSYSKAKITLGNIFIDLSEIKQSIDKKFYLKYKDFKKLYFEHLSSGFFGTEKLNNKEFILRELKVLKNDLKLKCEDLSK